MPLHHKILALVYYPLSLIKSIGRALGVFSNNRLRVLIYHDIAPEDEDRFAAQLRWLARSWNFISPDQFSAMMRGEIPVVGSNLLLTFDDGFVSNRRIAERILNPLGIKAIFFVVSELVEIDDRIKAREFIARNIYLGTRAEQLPTHWENMTWLDLEALLKQGHYIGCHTRDHTRLSSIKTDDCLENAIIHSASILEQRLGISVEHFSYPFGDLASFSAAAMIVARWRFRFIHSGLRGDNLGVSSFAIRRDSAAQQDRGANYTVFKNCLLGAFLEGFADAKYARDCDQLDTWAG